MHEIRVAVNHGVVRGFMDVLKKIPCQEGSGPRLDYIAGGIGYLVFTASLEKLPELALEVRNWFRVHLELLAEEPQKMVFQYYEDPDTCHEGTFG